MINVWRIDVIDSTGKLVYHENNLNEVKILFDDYPVEDEMCKKPKRIYTYVCPGMDKIEPYKDWKLREQQEDKKKTLAILEDTCKKCGNIGEVNRTACICPNCNNIIWGC